MRLCITEKPSVGRDIAAILGATTIHQGYREGNGWCVTWTFGHLCELKEPHDYTAWWKAWCLSRLPMMPPRFGIKVKDDEGIKRQFAVIEDLISKATDIVNCGDAGQEGELIQRWVMQKAGARIPVQRLWISSLTDQAIREGFQHLRPAADFDRLYYAGLCRAIGDWLLGINATRLYSLKYSRPGHVLSLGRVQTPTLALIVAREAEIASFKPSDSWELQTLYRDTRFISTGRRYNTEADGKAALQSITGQPFTVTDVGEKRGREAPPRLFDLTSLQVECNKKWGWSADETLKLIQSLYEKKVTTYPRVDTTYLSEDLYAKVPGIISQMTPYAPLTAPILAKKLPKSKKVFDDSKVTDHHAIIPTGESPSALIGNERPLYHLIARRFIAAFYPDCIFNTTTIMGQSVPATTEDDKTPKPLTFKATGKVIIDPGWRAVYASDKSDPSDKSDSSDSPANAEMPAMTKGETGPHTPSLAKKTTQPPKHYTEGTLLRAMEGAGKTVDDEALREAMKENGIGRPSTRAAIIETLFQRRYIQRQGKSIISTQAGNDLISLIREPLLKSAKLTGMWERKLRMIEAGQYDPNTFIQEMKAMVNDVVTSVMSEQTTQRITVPDDPQPKAPKDPKAKKSPAKKP